MYVCLDKSKGEGWKWLWPTLNYYCGIKLKDLRKIMKKSQ
jgi:hypothetical protein